MRVVVTTTAVRCKLRNLPDSVSHMRRCRICGRPVAKAVAKINGVCGKCMPSRPLDKEALI